MSEKALLEPDPRRAGVEAITASGPGPEVPAPTHDAPERGSLVLSSPSHCEAVNQDPATPAAERPEPRNTNCTVGPATRAAIRKFQLAANEAETGEPSKMMFESLKKKKCASTVP